MKTLNREVGSRIRKARQDAGLTQAELGDILGISGNAVTKLEGGHSALTIENLLALHRALHKPFSFFLGVSDTELNLIEEELLEVYRAMPERDQRYWLGMLQGWLRELEDDDLT